MLCACALCCAVRVWDWDYRSFVVLVLVNKGANRAAFILPARACMMSKALLFTNAKEPWWLVRAINIRR